jgi:hypothetical protein
MPHFLWCPCKTPKVPSNRYANAIAEHKSWSAARHKSNFQGSCQCVIFCVQMFLLLFAWVLCFLLYVRIVYPFTSKLVCQWIYHAPVN